MSGPTRGGILAWFALALGLLGMFAAGGCSAAPPPDAAELERAYSLVWEGVYGRAVAERPAVHWELRDNCTDEYGNVGVKTPTAGICSLGWAGDDGVHVMWLGYAPLADTSFAHELYHWAYYWSQPPWLRSVRGFDSMHATAGWSTLVPEAQRELEVLQ